MMYLFVIHSLIDLSPAWCAHLSYWLYIKDLSTVNKCILFPNNASRVLYPVRRSISHPRSERRCGAGSTGEMTVVTALGAPPSIADSSPSPGPGRVARPVKSPPCRPQTPSLADAFQPSLCAPDDLCQYETTCKHETIAGYELDPYPPLQK